MKQTLTVLLCCAANVIAAQLTIQDLKWEAWLGAPKTEIVRCLVTENARKEVALFAQSARKGYLFSIIDPMSGTTTFQTKNQSFAGDIAAIHPLKKGYLIVGSQGGRGGAGMVWILTAEGEIQQEIQPPALKGLNQITAFAKAPDGSMWVAGKQKDQLRIIRFDARWENVLDQFPGSADGNTEIVDLAIDKIGNLYFAAWESQKNQSYLRLIKYNIVDKKHWEKRFDQFNCLPKKITVTDEEAILITGMTWSPETQENVFLVKLDLEGSLIWHKSLGDDYQWEEGTSVQQLPDRNYLITGSVYPFGAVTSNVLVQKVDFQTGELLESAHYGDRWMDQGQQLLRLSNDNIILASSSVNDQNKRAAAWLVGFPHSPCERKLSPEEHFSFAATTDLPEDLSEKEWLNLEGTVVSRYPLEAWDFRIRSQHGNAKAPSTIELESLPTFPEQYCYQLKKSQRLDPGPNDISFQIHKEGHTYRDSMKLFHLPARPKLHVLAIGINYYNLDFTGNDAGDFSTLFSSQTGGLFREVHTELLNTREETTADRINKALFDLKDRYEGGGSGPAISPEDVLVVFISSHGELINDKFVLPGSDFRWDNDRSYVWFKEDVLDVLEGIRCKKLIFIDACKSGGVKDFSAPTDTALMSNILRLIDSRPELSVITSCSKDQSSYEHPEINNGFFTEAIIEGLSNRSNVVDRNQDKVITLEELYNDLKIRVPELLFQYYADPRKKQTPAMPMQGLDRELPLFYLGNNE